MQETGAVRPLAALALVTLLLCGTAAADTGAAAGAGPRRALHAAAAAAGAKQYPFTYGAYDRRAQTGWAKGAKAGGSPEPVQGLMNPDKPALGDLVLPWGYPLESYPVETPDGFILRLYRIPYGAKNATRADPSKPKPAVLLHHGVTLASSSFVVLDPDSSMGFYLADAGFDVWLANTRTNTFSRGNRYYRETDEGYYQYSMDELALADLPSQIDFVLKKAAQPSLAFVGHSQGCTLPLMLLAAKPEYSEKLWLLMLLGAVTHAQFIQAPYLRHQMITNGAVPYASAGIGEFGRNRVASQVVRGCKYEGIRGAFCSALINFAFYGPSTQVSPDDLTRVASTWVSGVGVRNLIHWSQMMNSSSGLRMFDYGTDCHKSPATGRAAFQESCNQAMYGQEEPPTYDLSQVKGVKVAIFQGDNDLMATVPDVNRLLKAWRADVIYNVMWNDTAHMDFVCGQKEGAWVPEFPARVEEGARSQG
ncbi:MAG: Alpha/Beta hydrolase protein [Monoraphidium minutum]|nr:MAG: Alpha/Beta hydrolase protein [Monoraphidium minutum]